MEIFRKDLSQASGSLCSYKGIFNPPQLQIPHKGFCPGAADVVGYQQSPAFQAAAKLSSLPARSGAQIQDHVPRGNRETAGRSHGAGLLKVVESCLIIRMPGGTVFTPIEKTVFHPWNRSKVKGGDFQKLFHTYLFGVYPESELTGRLIAFQKSRKLLFQHFFHSFKKCLGKLCVHI